MSDAIRLPSDLEDLGTLYPDIPSGRSVSALMGPAAIAAAILEALGGDTLDADSTQSGVFAATSGSSGTSTFSGWGSAVGVQQNFSRLTIGILPYIPVSSTAINIPTIGRLRIKNTDANGAVLADVTFPITGGQIGVIQYVNVDVPFIANASATPLWVEFDTNGRTGRFIVSGVPYSIAGGYPADCCFLDFNINSGLNVPITAGVAQANLWVRFSRGNTYRVTENDIPSLNPEATNAAFSGWAIPLGAHGNFNRYETQMWLPDPGSLPAAVRVRIVDADTLTTVYADQQFTLAIDPTYAGKTGRFYRAVFDFSEVICKSATPNLRAEVLADGYWAPFIVYNAGAIPTGLQYQTNRALNPIPAWSNATANAIWSKLSLVDRTQKRLGGAGGALTSIDSAVRRFATPVVCLPRELDAVVGHEFNLYFEDIVREAGIPADQLRYDVAYPIDSTKGAQQNLRWTYTPGVGEIGDNVLTLTIYAGSVVLWTGSTVLRVKAALGVGSVARKCLVIGDSTTIDGSMLAELTNLLNFNHTSPTPAGGADNLTVTFVGAINTPSTNDAGGTGRVVACEAVSGQDVDYFYSNAASHFVIAAAFNFAGYLAAQSITLAANDWVIINLGINDMSNLATDALALAEIRATATQLDAMITSIKAAVAGIRIGIALIIPPSRDQSAAGAAYFSGQTAWRYRRNRDLWNEFFRDYYYNTTNVYLVPLGHGLDTRNNMQTTTQALNAYNATTEVTQSNLVHPAVSGYRQIATMLYCFLRGQEA